MNTSKRNKIKAKFTRDQKENINTQDGKRNLYFDRERENFIKFGLVVGTTCSYILKNYKEDIINKLKEINRQEEVNLNNYSFFIVELIANKYEKKQTLIDLKINMEDSSLFNILQNRQLILCFLPVEKSDISLRLLLAALPSIWHSFCTTWQTTRRPQRAPRSQRRSPP